jgi:uncharacterized protein
MEMSQSGTPQQEVIDYLSLPESHGGMPVTRSDTHAAIVFLAGTRAIKIKRAVRFPYLDFSTLEKRKTACETELAINRTFAPTIYRRVVAITRETNDHLAIDGKGSPVEWGVEMNRFDADQTFDHLADDGRIDTHLSDELGSVVAHAHARAPVVESFNFIESLEKIIVQNDSELSATPNLFSPQAIHALIERTHTALTLAQPLLIERQRLGLIRRCHGDLHLGNIVLIDDRPTLFDAIEFDERMATSDVLYDLAFLLMDLIKRGMQATANIVLNRYLTETRRLIDLDGLMTLPLFMSIRAIIRAKVKATLHIHSSAPDKISQEARDYFALAQRLIAPSQPRLIAIGGLSGTGKSALAHLLAPMIMPAPGAVVLRSDVERKALFGVPETEKLPPEAYSREVSKKIYTLLVAKACRIIAAGHSVIVDAVFASTCERSEINHMAGGALFHGLFLTTDLATRSARLHARIHDASDADAAVARAQEHYDLGKMDWPIVDASGTPEETLDRARSALLLR